MSFIDEQSTRVETAGGFVEKVGVALTSFMRCLWGMGSSIRAGLEASRLNKLSDAELGRYGIKREEIVSHAFRNRTDEQPAK